MADVAKVMRNGETGCRVGESHPRSKVSDNIVLAARDLYEVHNLVPAEIARKLGVAYNTVRDWVYYKRRNTVARVD